MNNEKVKKNVLNSGKNNRNSGKTIYNSVKVRIYMKKELKNSWVIYYRAIFSRNVDKIYLLSQRGNKISRKAG